MKKPSLVSLFLLLSFLTALRGQTVSPASEQSEDEVVRITTNLVQVDAVVTDKDGKQVTDLRPEDFEILEDGRAQTLTNFSYVAAAPTLSQPVASATSSPNKTGPLVRPARLRPTDAHRTILLVVDDLGLTNESTNATRKALRKFIDEQMRPSDLVAVVTTSGGSSAWQQLTSDKRILGAAIERIRWYPLSRSGFDSFSSGSGSNSDMSRSGPTLPVASSSPADIPAPGTGAGVGPSAPVTDSIKALRFILAGLKGLPGRKSVVLFSDNFTIFAALKGNELEQYERLLRSGARPDAKDAGGLAKAMEKQMEEMELKNISLSDNRQSAGDAQSLVSKLIDAANQASAVIYTVDPRGLLVYGLAADTDGKQALETGDSPGSLDNLLNVRSLKIRQSQVSLDYVAQQTGGFLVRNTTDLSAGLQRVLDDTRGYYLIGYRPAEGTFDNGARSRFHKIRVSVKRPGLTVRSRKGFYAVSVEAPVATAQTRTEQLLAAINSPFQSGGVNLRLTSLFGNEQARGSYVRTLLHIDAGALSFKPDAEGWQTALMEVLAMTFDENGAVIEQAGREETISVKGATYQRLLRNGLVYAFDLPVRKAGSYQLRVAVRDAASQRIGSAQQLIEIPDLTKSGLALSGIVARGIDPASAAAPGGALDATGAGLLAGPPKISEAEGSTDTIVVQPGPESRRLRRGLALEYIYTIFNARRNPATNRTQLQTRTVIFRDGQQVWAGDSKPVETSGESNAEPLTAMGRLLLAAEMTPGEYVLQVVVTDMLATGEKRTATQWTDFEVLK